MPELPEVERYRTLLGAAALGRPVTEVVAPDAWYLKRGTSVAELRAALVGRRLVAARRRGKLLLAEVEGAPDAPVLGLRFGMSGRLLVDDAAGVDRLLYAPAGDDARYDRFGLRFADGGVLRVSDPRRLGGVELDPDVDALGPDALTVTARRLGAALAGSAPLKARLLDQARVAGIGNLVADEALWRAGLAPGRAAGGLDGAEVALLAAAVRSTLRLLIGRGGSHTGDLMPERRPGGHCPRDGAELRRATIGGRTSWWCPTHQR
ncbi:MAG TPA: DNA-formamidopyrimidine glycosylase family protein [Acidimicrobiales bacterium]|nr:DNA-formamidopyrimidine glycosylase family protein [Acidimicrobiales bacterium]